MNLQTDPSGLSWQDGTPLTAAKMQTFDGAKLNASRLGQAGGVAQLDQDGRISSPVGGDISSAQVSVINVTRRNINEKLRDVVSVADCGAVGDLATATTPTDNTAAFARAAASGATVLCLGSYHVATAVTGAETCFWIIAGEVDNLHYLPGNYLIVNGGALRTRNPIGSWPEWSSSSLASPYTVMMRDLLYQWWDYSVANGYGGPRIKLTQTEDANNGVRNADQSAAALPSGTFWQMCMMHNVYYADWVATRSGQSAGRVAQQYAFMRACFPVSKDTTTYGLGSDGSADGTIVWSDDAAWKCKYLMQVHEVTGDQTALVYLMHTIVNTLTRFADTNTTQIDAGYVPGGDLKYSKYGILYKLGQTGDSQISAPYECGIAVCALYAYHQTGYQAFLTYAQAVWGIAQGYWKSPSGNMAQSIVIAPSSTSYLKDPQSYFGYPKEGLTNMCFVGTQAAAVLGAILYRETGDATYLTGTQALLTAMVQPQTGTPVNTNTNWGFVSTTTTTTGVFLAMTDPYTDGQWMPEVARYVLTIPGADIGGAFRDTLIATGRSIVAQRTVVTDTEVQTFAAYTGDWGGALTAQAAQDAKPGLLRGYDGYQSHYNAIMANWEDGDPDQAGGQQIMVNGSSASVVAAAYTAERMLAGLYVPNID